jgi:hypothetical protein
MSGPQDQDVYLAEHVREALATDERVNEPELDVEIQDGRVIVTGAVPTEERRAAIEAVVVDCCPGLEVDNRTTVDRLDEPKHEERLA